MRVLIWHVHGGYTDAFVRGHHEYLLPLAGDGGGGRQGRDWPAAREIPESELRNSELDVVVLQRPGELELVERLTGRRPGRELPALYLEHNTPKPDVTGTRHPLADRDDIRIVHVTHFNALFWDNGRAPTVVVEHGVPDPGLQYNGRMPRLGVVANETVRHWRITGTDRLTAFAEVAPVDVFGMKAEGVAAALGVSERRVTAAGDLPPAELHPQLAQRRVYVHPFRWTSLGLALLEAMHLGMPVVGVAATEAPRAVPPEAGFVSNDLDALTRETRRLLADPDLAVERGCQARRFALQHYGLDAFLQRWDAVLAEAVASAPARSPARPLASPGGV